MSLELEIGPARLDADRNLHVTIGGFHFLAGDKYTILEMGWAVYFGRDAIPSEWLKRYGETRPKDLSYSALISKGRTLITSHPVLVELSLRAWWNRNSRPILTAPHVQLPTFEEAVNAVQKRKILNQFNLSHAGLVPGLRRWNTPTSKNCGRSSAASNRLKLANWNLERATTSKRRGALRKHTDRIAADLWVFTETNDAFTPGLPYSCGSMASRDGILGLDTTSDRWVMIWSKYPLEQLATNDPIRTTAARVYPDNQSPFLIFGTILPWGGDQWHGHSSAGGVAFREALALQQSNWMNLRREYPNDELFVLGDFNQDLAPTRYYGSKFNRAALAAALNECGLVALTAGNNDPIRRDSPPYACIDHICALRESCWHSDPPIRWPDSSKPDKQLSDHFGVAVTLNKPMERTTCFPL